MRKQILVRQKNYNFSFCLKAMKGFHNSIASIDLPKIIDAPMHASACVWVLNPTHTWLTWIYKPEMANDSLYYHYKIVVTQ